MSEEKLRLYLYVSRHSAQDVSCSLMLNAGPSQYIALSAERWASGVEAAARLAISGEAVEFCCEVEVVRTSLQGPERAQELYATDGSLLRPGGAPEYRLPKQVLVFVDPPQWIGLDSP